MVLAMQWFERWEKKRSTRNSLWGNGETFGSAKRKSRENQKNTCIEGRKKDEDHALAYGERP